jgi:hypothetical protein
MASKMASGSAATIEPAFPALTCTAQVSCVAPSHVDACALPKPCSLR